MDWNDLSIFLAVAKHRQLARAGASLGVDATTVGRRIRRLEKVLGERLFEQRADGQALTPAGERLSVRAEAIAQIAGQIAEESTGTPEITGPVRVSVSEGLGSSFIAHHLAELADSHPRLAIDLVANSGFLNPTRRETDVAVLLARPRRGPLVTRRLTDYALCLYASRDYLASHAPIRSIADLAAHRLIGYIPDIIYAPELTYLDELAGAHEPQLKSSSINAQAQMVAAGAGIAILPCFIADRMPVMVRLLPDIRIFRTFWLVTHQETRNFRAVRTFTDWLVDLAARERSLFRGEI